MSWDLFLSYEMLEDIAISLGILLLFLIFRKIFAKYVFTLLLKISKKAPSDFFSHIFLAFEKPVQVLFIIIGIYVSIRYFPHLDHTNPLFRDIIRSSVIFVIGWGLFNLSSASSILLSKIDEKHDFDDILIPFISKLIRFIVVAIVITVIAQEFDYDVNGFITGLGLGGLAIALAAKDALSNLFGGFVIITEKPFTIGEWVMTPTVEGVVEDISFRSTKIRTFAQALVTVPNATLANEAITNWSKMGKRRIYFNLRVTYDTPQEKLHAVVKQIEALLKSHSGVHQETIFVAFNNYEESGYEIMLYFFTKTIFWGEYLSVREDVNFSIMEILENEGVSIAVPSRRLYVDDEFQDEQDILGQQGS